MRNDTAVAALLERLADGHVHSGEELAHALGVSRTAIWKQLKKLGDLPVSLETVRGQGYRIPGGLDLLDPVTIGKAIRNAYVGRCHIEIFQSLESTNSWLSAQSLGEHEFRVCMSERQTAGRGRRGREWVSPFARNIYLSLATLFQGGFAGLEGLSLVVGVAVVRALASLGVEGLELKWPNDIWLQGKKLGGVLIELQGEVQSACKVVIGIGLNVRMLPDEVAIDQAWTSLAQVEEIPGGGRSRIAGALIDSLVDTLDRFACEGLSSWLPAWQELDALKGRQVRTLPEQFQGVALGVDEAGAYCIETEAGIRKVNSGELSLRSLS